MTTSRSFRKLALVRVADIDRRVLATQLASFPTAVHRSNVGADKQFEMTMWIETACEAIRKGRVLDLRYDGFSRSVEVHAVGYSKTGHPLMRAWQVGGGSASGEKVGWKLMRMDEAAGAALSSDASAAPRRGFKRNDPAIERIVCEV